VNIDSTVTHVLAAVSVIIGLSYLVGQLFRRIRQPEVIGQLLTGIALGPSLLGRFGGSVSHALLPTNIVPYLTVISQVGLVLFLFAVGYEIDLRLVRRQRSTVPVLAVLAFCVPAALGIISVYVFENLYQAVGESDVISPPFVLFIGIAISVTAVPVLASIIGERGLAATVPGATAMASAALIDVLDWIMLAGVLVMVGVSSRTHRSWVVMLLLLVVYIAVAIFIVRPLLRRWLRRPTAVVNNNVPVVVAVAMGSAWATAALGLHVIFGAFLAGAIMPRQEDGRADPDLLQPLLQIGRLLLPIFFVVSGLSVNIGMLQARDFELLAVVCGIAIFGKIGIGFVAGTLTKLGKRDSLMIGVLLNARGLTELIALNVGLQAGIIHQRLYTILVVMAIVMTVLTGPLLTLVGRLKWPDAPSAPTSAVPAGAGLQTAEVAGDMAEVTDGVATSSE
jgi:Kef-type K+ transport system membrane component KefB